MVATLIEKKMFSADDLVEFKKILRSLNLEGE